MKQDIIIKIHLNLGHHCLGHHRQVLFIHSFNEKVHEPDALGPLSPFLLLSVFWSCASLSNRLAQFIPSRMNSEKLA